LATSIRERSDAINPSEFRPQCPADFIGSAQSTARLLLAKADRLKPTPDSRLKLLFHGAPGTGKSELARLLAHELTGTALAIEHLNGQTMSVELVRDWHRNSGYRPMFSQWAVKWVDEIDRASEAAQSELLTYLDGLPPQTAFIATTNQTLRQLSARVQSRFLRFHFKPVSECEIADWLAKRFDIPADDACRIACDNRGNVRGALLDAETLLDSLAVESPSSESVAN
jgi:replication-associated recombination protein RarA